MFDKINNNENRHNKNFFIVFPFYEFFIYSIITIFVILSKQKTVIFKIYHSFRQFISLKANDNTLSNALYPSKLGLDKVDLLRCQH